MHKSLYFSLLLIFSFCISCKNNKNKLNPHLSCIKSSINVNFPKNLLAKNELKGTIKTSGCNYSDGYFLIFYNSNFIYETKGVLIQKEVFEFKIKNEIIKMAGIYNLSIVDKYGNQCYIDKLTVSSERPNHIISFVGHKYQIVDYGTPASYLGMVCDNFGNPIDYKDSILIKEFDDNNKENNTYIYGKNLIYKMILKSFKNSGNYYISSSKGNLAGKQHFIKVSSKSVSSLSFYIESTNQIADGVHKIVVKSKLLTDQFSNLLPDGSIVHFKMKRKGGDEVYDATGIVQNGIASSEFISPSNAGEYHIWMEYLNLQSAVQTINFEKGVSNFEVYIYKSKIIIKNIISPNNHKVADGTPCKIVLKENDNDLIRFGQYFENGEIFFNTNKLYLQPSKSYRLYIDILGMEKVYNLKTNNLGKLILK